MGASGARPVHPAVTNFRSYAEWLARKNRAFNKTHRRGVLYHRGGSAVFGVLGIGAIDVGVVRIANGVFGPACPSVGVAEGWRAAISVTARRLLAQRSAAGWSWTRR